MATSGVVVVVTGATGFVGSHVIKQLLEKGYTVRGTVRNAKDESRLAFLHAMVPAGGAAGQLSFFSADLGVEGSYDEVLKGADYLVHTAASVMLTAKDPQKEIIDVTVNGLKNVMSSVEKVLPDGKLKKIVMTSSVAAVEDNNRPKGHLYTEADFNESASVSDAPYQRSKYLSEILARDRVAELNKTYPALQIAFINPGAIYGPVLTQGHLVSSPTIIHDLMQGKFPGAPKLAFPGVDVRDVASAHIEAMESMEITGRFIMSENTYSIKDLADMGKELFPLYKWPTWQLPNALMYVGAIFDKRLSFAFLRNNLDQPKTFDSSKFKSTFKKSSMRPMKDTIKDTAESFIELGFVPKK